VLYAANEGYLKDVEVEKVGDFEAALLAYMHAEQGELMNNIASTGDYNDSIAGGIKSALESFKATQTW